MEKFTVLTGVAAPIPMPNISTDLIAPSHFPGKKPEEAIVMSFKDKLFANLRFFPDGTPKTDFVLGESRYQAARILLTGEILAAAARVRPPSGRCRRPVSPASSPPASATSSTTMLTRTACYPCACRQQTSNA